VEDFDNAFGHRMSINSEVVSRKFPQVLNSALRFVASVLHRFNEHVVPLA
jgi:hypothetical protein